MKQPRSSSDPITQANDIRARMADRLGFLLAKRWLRIHRESEANRAKKAFSVDSAKPDKSER